MAYVMLFHLFFNAFHHKAMMSNRGNERGNERNVQIAAIPHQGSIRTHLRSPMDVHEIPDMLDSGVFCHDVLILVLLFASAVLVGRTPQR